MALEEHTAQQAAPIFEFAAYIRYSETDHTGKLTLPALINYFQDCSTFQSEALGVGMAWLKAQHRGWVLTHWQIVVDRYPKLAEPVTVGTFASTFKGLTATRFFYLRDASGTLIARARSVWAYMDFAKGRPVRPEAEQTALYGTSEPLDMPAEARRVKVPAELDPAAPVVVRPDQIDTNEHVNNCQYIQMALDLLKLETAPAQIRVDYKHAAVLGDTIYPALAHDGNCAIVSLNNESGAPYAVIELSEEVSHG